MNCSEVWTERDKNKLIAVSPHISTLVDLLDDLNEDQRTFLKFYKHLDLQRCLSFHDFYVQANQLADLLAKQDLQTQTNDLRIGICMRNSDQILIAYAACWLLGATIVPINPQESDEYIERILLHSQSSLLLVDQKRLVSSTPQTIMNEPLMACIGDEIPSLIKKRFHSPKSEDIAAIFYTSGTTSAPKGVMLSHRALLANMRSLILTHAIKPDHIHLCILPLYHVNAFAFSFLTNLLARSRLALADRFQPELFWDLVHKTQCHTANVVPEVVKRLSQETEIKTEHIADIQKSVHYFVSAASALTRQAYDEFSLRFPIRLLQGYGLSETVNFSLLISPNCTKEEYQWAMTARERPSAGSTILGNDVEILAPDSDIPCKPGEIGEIAIRGQNIMSGYLNNIEAQNAAFRSGWFRTGDLAYYEFFDQKRYFFIAGRIKETVKRNSETIYIQEVEEALQLLPGCINSAVFGFSNFFTGEEVGAVIIKNHMTPAESEILHQLQQFLGWCKTPKIIRFVDKIPRTGSMKIQRRLLGTQFEQYYSQKFSIGQHYAHK